MGSTYQSVESAFQVDPDVPVEATIKRTVLRTVETYIKNSRYTFEQITRSTANALDLLTQVDTRGTSKQTQPKRTHKNAFFSTRRLGLVSFGSHKGRHIVQTRPMDDHLRQRHQPSPKQQTNKACEIDVINFLASYPANEIEAWILESVVQVLKGAEHFDGAFIDIFKRQQPLFGKLRQVYESAKKDGIDSIRGCYSNARAVEVYLASEAARREEELRREAGLRSEEEALFMEE